MKKNFIFGILLVFVLLLVGCLLLKDKEIKELENDLNELKNNETVETELLTEEKLKIHMGAWVTEKQQMTINEITYATSNLTINDYNVKVENNAVKINDTIKEIDNEPIEKVTGYFEQSADLIHIYTLSKNQNIYKLSFSKTNGLTDETFSNINLNNIDDLVLANVTIIQDEIGETPEKYRVYAIKDNEVLLVNHYEQNNH